MKTSHMPVYRIKEILIEKSRNLRKTSHTYSMFFYDDESNTITICTNRPGFWIGVGGTEIENLKEECRNAIRRHNGFQKHDELIIPENINIDFIECEC